MQHPSKTQEDTVRISIKLKVFGTEPLQSNLPCGSSHGIPIQSNESLRGLKII